MEIHLQPWQAIALGIAILVAISKIRGRIWAWRVTRKTKREAPRYWAHGSTCPYCFSPRNPVNVPSLREWQPCPEGSRLMSEESS